MTKQAEREEVVRRYIQKLGEDPNNIVRLAPVYGDWDSASVYEITRRDGTRRRINLQDLAPKKDESRTAERVFHIVLSVLMVGSAALVFFGVNGTAQVLFWLSFILALVNFAGYLFNWVILGIHGPGWIHPLDYLKRSPELRIVLIGAGCAALLWWQAH